MAVPSAVSVAVAAPPAVSVAAAAPPAVSVAGAVPPTAVSVAGAVPLSAVFVVRAVPLSAVFVAGALPLSAVAGPLALAPASEEFEKVLDDVGVDGSLPALSPAGLGVQAASISAAATLAAFANSANVDWSGSRATL